MVQRVGEMLRAERWELDVLPDKRRHLRPVVGERDLRSGAAACKDAELVALWVGKYDPARVVALTDVGMTRA